MSSNIPLARDIVKQVLMSPWLYPELRERLEHAVDLMHRSKPDFRAPRNRATPTPQQKANALLLRARGHSYDDIEYLTGMQRGRISETINPR